MKRLPHEAVSDGYIDVVRNLLNRGYNPNLSMNDDTDYPDYPLMEVISYNQVEMVKLLLDNGADPNINTYGESVEENSPLVLASADRIDKSIYDMLLEYGADPLRKDDQGYLPRHRDNNAIKNYPYEDKLSMSTHRGTFSRADLLRRDHVYGRTHRLSRQGNAPKVKIHVL